tara:strand:- start:81 stop:428 length:348 start_codon:yes stop_codon:yes gene_type:complete
MIQEISNPRLIEPGVKYFLKESLIICNKKKNTQNIIIFNSVLLILFSTILGGFLYYRYKSKLTPEEKKEEDKKKQTYFADKVRSMQEHEKKKYNLTITNLPKFESEFRTEDKIFI